MQLSLLGIIEKTTQHVKDYADGIDLKLALKELVQILFDQFKEVADAHFLLLRFIEKASKAHKVEVKSYSIQYYWSQVQFVVSNGSIYILDDQITQYTGWGIVSHQISSLGVAERCPDGKTSFVLTPEMAVFLLALS